MYERNNGFKTVVITRRRDNQALTFQCNNGRIRSHKIKNIEAISLSGLFLIGMEREKI
jgi:hypothetical protein